MQCHQNHNKPLCSHSILPLQRKPMLNLVFSFTLCLCPTTKCKTLYIYHLSIDSRKKHICKYQEVSCCFHTQSPQTIPADQMFLSFTHFFLIPLLLELQSGRIGSLLCDMAGKRTKNIKTFTCSKYG